MEKEKWLLLMGGEVPEALDSFLVQTERRGRSAADAKARASTSV